MPLTPEDTQLLLDADAAYRRLFYALYNAERRGARLRLDPAQRQAYQEAKTARNRWAIALGIREGVFRGQ